MFHTVRGDLLLSKADAIAHGVAPNDDFKSGLALALRARYPSMVKDFRHATRVHALEPGGIFTWAGVGPDGHAVRVINLLTQEPAKVHGGHPGRAHPEYVNRALHALVKEVRKEKIRSLALPRLATGVGGLTWEEVKPLIERQLGELEIPVYLYENYAAGEKAKEVGA